MSTADLSILICARNASGTVERAVLSALRQGPYPILLVDDWSTDETGEIAVRVGGDHIRVVKPDQHRSLGYARQTALEHASSEWIMWVDADDEALEGRAAAMLAEARKSAAQVVYDHAELFDGETGRKIKHLPIPSFVSDDPTASRQFERNFIPSLGWGLMQTEFARKVGYDAEAHGVEDFDFCLRAIRSGARFGYCSSVGYRQFAYTTSVSRDMYQRRADLVRVYAKHSEVEIRRVLVAAKWSERVISWVLVATAVFGEKYDEALKRVSDFPAVHGIVEPAGPYPVLEEWRIAFQTGTLCALLGKTRQAMEVLEKACLIHEAAESQNNLGVVLRRLNREGAASVCFAKALELHPGYVDAIRNQSDQSSERITPLPLRLQPGRNTY